MTRTRGWAARGSRLVAHVPHGHWKTLTFPAGLRHDRIVAPFVSDGAINGDTFTAWVEQCLGPTLTPADVVIADNLGSHKSRAPRQFIRNSGARLLFLPPLSLGKLSGCRWRTRPRPARGLAARAVARGSSADRL